MKSIWKIIVDGISYKDLGGNRQPRLYIVLTGLILLLLLMAWGMAILNRFLVMSSVRNNPVIIALTTTAQVTETHPAISLHPKDGKPIGCPTDPVEWSFTPTYASRNYSVIQPACVYQGLEKTIAWALAVREGYSRAEATQQLGFADMPMRPLDTVTIPVDSRGLAAVPVSFISPDPALTEWHLKASGEAAVTYALRGCFRTTTVTGNRVEIWGGDYPVICLVVEDAENTSIVYSLDGHAYTSDATPIRSFLLFGYLKDGLWVWLGTQDDPKHEITDPEIFAHERLTIATMYDSQPWDAKWLQTYYHLDMQSPPENWQSLNEESEKQAILNALSTDANGAAQ